MRDSSASLPRNPQRAVVAIETLDLAFQQDVAE